MQDRLGIPFIELLRLYRIDKIQNQYKLLGQALGAELDDTEYFEKARKTIDTFKRKHKNLSFSVGEIQNGDPIEMSLMLVEEGFKVKEVFATIGELNIRFMKRLAELSPDTKIYSNMSPSMMNYEEEKVDVYIGSDCEYYHPSTPGIDWCDDDQPFGYDGVIKLFEALDKAL